MVRNLLGKVGFAPGLSDGSVSGPEGLWASLAAIGQSCGSLRSFFSLSARTSSALPHVFLILPGSVGLLPQASRLSCLQFPLLSAIIWSNPTLARPGRKPPATLLSLLSILFLLQRQKQKQPVNRSAVSPGSLTPISHSHYFSPHSSTAGCPQEPLSSEA